MNVGNLVFPNATEKHYVIHSVTRDCDFCRAILTNSIGGSFLLSVEYNFNFILIAPSLNFQTSAVFFVVVLR